MLGGTDYIGMEKERASFHTVSHFFLYADVDVLERTGV